MQYKLIHESDGQRTYAVIMRTGDEVTASMKDFVARENVHAAQFTAIGGLSDVTLMYYDWDKKEYLPNRIADQVEVASLIGDVAQDPQGQPTIHMHITVGTRDGSAKAGHLGKGIVRPTLEVVVNEAAAHLRKVKDPVTGLAFISPKASYE